MLELVECVRGTQNQYLYILFNHQETLETSHKYHEMHMQLVPFHGPVPNGGFP